MSLAHRHRLYGGLPLGADTLLFMVRQELWYERHQALHHQNNTLTLISLQDTISLAKGLPPLYRGGRSVGNISVVVSCLSGAVNSSVDNDVKRRARHKEAKHPALQW